MKGLEKLLGSARLLRKRLDRRAVILMYHRVAEVRSDPWSLCVTPQHFAEHMEILRRHARPISLRELTGALREGSVPRRSVVVTFDDGYLDNLKNARPLLERYDIPATFFIATGYLGGEREFWWDELERMLLGPGTLPETLCLSIDGSDYHWELGEAANQHEFAGRQHRGWRAWEEGPTSRHSLYRSLWQLLQPLPETARREILDELAAWSGAGPQDGADHRPLTIEEVIALAKGPLFEVGSHTITHPVLSALPADSQRDEIRQSKAELEEILGDRVTSFAYPYGGKSNYTDETIAIVCEAGFTSACSTLAKVVERGADRFQLPRLQVNDSNGEEFYRWLNLIQTAG